jgi:hypothetical protein
MSPRISVVVLGLPRFGRDRQRRRRHKVSSRGSTTFSDAVVFGKLGVLRLRDVHLGRLS